jgi:hypothetical protein
MNTEEPRFGSEQEPIRQSPVDHYAMGGFLEPLPNSTGILVLGILSIVTCSCYGIPGIVMAIIALVMSSKASNLVNSQPDRYSPASVKNYQSGRVCAIIGLIVSILFLVFMGLYIAMVGTMMTNPDAFKDYFNF